jgi:hypothetical protein
MNCAVLQAGVPGIVLGLYNIVRAECYNVLDPGAYMLNEAPRQPASPAARPECMVTLGLLPPYSAEDVEKAYLTKLKEIRPDLGGDREAFYAVQNAYIQAKEYVKFRGDRRGWIARQMDEYLAVQEVIERLRQFGADVATDSLDWLRRSFGEFAQLTEAVISVRLQNAPNGDEVLEYLVRQHEQLRELRHLDLAGSNVSDASVRQLSVFRHLAELNLSRTQISWEGLHVVQWLPELEFVHVEGTQLKWLTRQRLARRLRRNRKAAAAARTVHPINVR